MKTFSVYDRMTGTFDHGHSGWLKTGPFKNIIGNFRMSLLYNSVWFLATVFSAALFAPVVLFVFLWRKVFSQRKDTTAAAVSILISVSYGYLMAALAFKSIFLGGDYSDRLFTTVEANTALTFCLFLFAVIRKSPVRTLLSCSALATSFAWFFVWAVNATV